MTSRIKRHIHISPRAGFFLAGMGISLVLFANIVSGAIPCVTQTAGGTTGSTHTTTTTTGPQGNGNGNGAGSGQGTGNGSGQGNGNGSGHGQGNGNGLGIGITVSGGGNGGGLAGSVGIGTGSTGSGSDSGTGANSGCNSPLLALTTAGILNSCTTATATNNGGLVVNHTSELTTNSVESTLLGSALGNRLSGNNSNGSTSTGNASGASQQSAVTVSVNPRQSRTQSSVSQQPTHRHTSIRVATPNVSSVGNGISLGGVGNATSPAHSLVTVSTSQPSSQSGNGSVLNLGL